MSSQEFKTYEISPALNLVVEKIPYVSSAALAVLIASGSAVDEPGQEGTASILVEMLSKGAGPYSSRALSDEFENLGIHRHQSCGVETSMISAALLAENLPRALELVALMLSDPHLPEAELDAVRELALQDLASIEDEPSSKAMDELFRAYYPEPLNRPHTGSVDGVKSVNINNLKNYHRDRFMRGKLIIGIAGGVDPDQARELVSKLFSGWKGTGGPLAVESPPRVGKRIHLKKDSAQVQIALAYPSVSHGHEFYYAARLANGILSGGMAGRLFIEVREKRGLVYRVGSTHNATRNRAAVFAFAGTTPERASDTLKVLTGELEKLQDGVTEEELTRSRTEIKSSLIMSSEQSISRANALVTDMWNLGRIRQLDEIKAGLEAVTIADVAKYAQAFPVVPYTLVTVGSKEL